MPFYGRPSKNCESCRERRIKCDRLQPVCSQCKRAGKPCGGYRDVPALLFRDETDKAAHRSATAKSRAGERRKVIVTDLSKKLNSPKSVLPAPWLTPPSSVENGWSIMQNAISLDIMNPAIPAVVSLSVDEKGLQFFFTRFTLRHMRVDNPQTSGIAGFPPLLRHIFDELPLRDAVVAVGLSALSNVKNDRALRLAAREKYAVAIKYVRQAVENPDVANPDHTLKLIVMLALYEMTSCNASTFDIWTMHINGAAALMKSSSFNQAFRAVQARPHLQFYYISIVRYFIDQGPASDDLLNYDINTIPSPSANEMPAVYLIDILVRFIKLHQSLRTDLNCDPATAVRLIQGVDSELVEWEINLPEAWAFVLKDTDDLEYSYMGKRMVYDHSWGASDINHYLWARLKANELILSYCARLESPTLMILKQRQRAFDNCTRMITFICASIASLMYSWVDSRSIKPSSNWTPPLNGVFMALFPMAMAGSSAVASEEAHNWILQRLENIGYTMGIQRATELIPHVKRLRQWKQEKLKPTAQTPPLSKDYEL